jgi:hypothetical protein
MLWANTGVSEEHDACINLGFGRSMFLRNISILLQGVTIWKATVLTITIGEDLKTYEIRVYAKILMACF